MNLISEGLDMIRDLQVVFKALDGLLVLVSGWEHTNGYGNTRGIIRVHHGWMNFRRGAEDGPGLGH